MKVCITCQKDVEGKNAVRVREDRVIRTIRAIKQAFRVAQMNELYVCQEDVKAHQERRRGFERSMLLAAILAGIIILLLIITSVLSGRFEVYEFFAGILLALVILAFPLFRYAPSLDGMPVKPFGKQTVLVAAPAAAPKVVPTKEEEKEPEDAPQKLKRQKKK
jgi:hypothetical protein